MSVLDRFTDEHIRYIREQADIAVEAIAHANAITAWGHDGADELRHALAALARIQETTHGHAPPARPH